MLITIKQGLACFGKKIARNDLMQKRLDLLVLRKQVGKLNRASAPCAHGIV